MKEGLWDTDLGTSESPRVMVVGSSSKIEAMSWPCGTDTRQYTGALGFPRSFDRIISGVGSLSTSAAKYCPVARCLKRKRLFQ